MEKAIMDIKSIFHICGEAISVEGKLLIENIEVGQTVCFKPKESSEFYATIIEIKVKGVQVLTAMKGEIVALSLQDMGTNIIVNGMRVYKA